MRPRSASSSTKPDSDGVAAMQPAPSRPATDAGQQVAVQMRRRRRPTRRRPPASRSPSASTTPRARPPSTDPRHDVGTGAHPDSAQHRAFVQRPRPSRRRPPRTCQRAEGLLDVGHDGQRGRSPPRVGAGVGRVAVEQHPQPRVAQVAAAQPAQRLPRRDRAQVGRSAGPGAAGRAPPSSGDSRNGPRVTCQIRVRAVDQPVPVRAGARAEGLVQRDPAAARARRWARRAR